MPKKYWTRLQCRQRFQGLLSRKKKTGLRESKETVPVMEKPFRFVEHKTRKCEEVQKKKREERRKDDRKRF